MIFKRLVRVPRSVQKYVRGKNQEKGLKRQKKNTTETVAQQEFNKHTVRTERVKGNFASRFNIYTLGIIR